MKGSSFGRSAETMQWIIAEKGGSMKTKMLVALIAVLGLGIAGFASASNGKKDAPEQKQNPAPAGEVIVVEGVSWVDCCAQDPASPCVKDGKCACKNKKECKDCMKHMKKCSTAEQGKQCPENMTKQQQSH